MSTYYLIDPFDPSQAIIDVSRTDLGQVEATGSVVVRVPAGVAIHGHPSNLAELQSAKALGLLAYYTGFANIEANDCLTSTEVNSAASAGVLTGAGTVNHSLYPGGVLTTGSIALAGAPSQCVVTWEVHSFLNSDSSADRFSRVYVEEGSELFACDVTFGGLGTNSATSGVVLNVPPADQGSSVVLTFTNNSLERLFLGGWAVIY